MDDTYPQPPTGPTYVPGPGVLHNDTNPCGTAAVLTVVKQPKYGQVDLLRSGGFNYNPSSKPNRADYFIYQIECPNGLVSEAAVFLPGTLPPGSNKTAYNSSHVSTPTWLFGACTAALAKQ